MITIAVGKNSIQGTNRQELLSLKKEIFNESIYYISINTATPTIIDAGAHVGLATLYFKKQWPTAHITAVEPLPQNVSNLRHNIWQNKLDNIEVIEAALSSKEGEKAFYFDQSEDKWLSAASFQPGAWDKSQTSGELKVKTILLDSLLTKNVDLLKMDIEGAETEVLYQSKLLHHVQNIIIELHPPNTTEDIIRIFRKTHNVEIRKHHFDLKLCYITKI
jgi:FkbM family methyltransferase